MNNIQKKELELAWEKLGNIPVIEDENSCLITDEDFEFFSSNIGTITFSKGTDREEIWHWFDEQGFNVGNKMNGLDPWSNVNVDTKILTEDQIIKQIQEWLTNCDADVLAFYVGEFFGGNCHFNLTTSEYEFTPNADYAGAFER